MNHFEQGLKGQIKQIIAEYAHTSFKEMYQRAVKIARIINEIEIEDRGKGQVKEKFGPRGSNSQGGISFWTVKYGMKQDKGKQASQVKLRKAFVQCGRQHPGPCRCRAGPCFGCGGMGHKVANCPRATWISQGHSQRSEMGLKLAAQRDRLTIGTPSRDSMNNQEPQIGSRTLS